jgi:alcohol dehydrogenase
MKDFTFYNPVRIVFGKDKTGMIGEVTVPFGKRALLVYGKESIKANGIYDKVTKSLSEAGVEYVELGGVSPNPVLSFVKGGIKLFKEEKLDCIVAVGGGSVIDTAKTIAAGVCYDGEVWDFFCGKAEVQDAVPITVVLTLAAAASEMNSGGVITNEETSQKFHLVGEPLFPKVSILDPTNTLTVPRTYSMYGAVDAIIHILEVYFNCSEKETPLQDRLAEGIIRTIMESSEMVFDEPEDYKARAELMWCASLALNGLVPAGIGPTGFPMHMIEHSLSALYDIAHGAGLAIIAPAWMRYKCKTEPEKFAQFAAHVFNVHEGTERAKAQKAIDKLKKWFASIDVPVTLEEAGIPKEDIPKISQNAFLTSEQWQLSEEYTTEVITEILEMAVG